MYKNSLYSLLLVLILPLIMYLFLYTATYNYIQMPPRYYPDYIIETIHKGRVQYDTIFHAIDNISLLDDRSAPITLNNALHGKVSLIYMLPESSIDSTTLRNIQQLVLLKQEIKIDSFLNIMCLSTNRVPSIYMLSNINYFSFRDTIEYNQFRQHVLKLHSKPYTLPIVILVDKAKIIRNYYILQIAYQQNLLQDIILLNLER